MRTGTKTSIAEHHPLQLSRPLSPADPGVKSPLAERRILRLKKQSPAKAESKALLFETQTKPLLTGSRPLDLKLKRNRVMATQMSAKPSKLAEVYDKRQSPKEPAASQKVSPTRKLATGGASRAKISQLKLVNWDFNQLSRKPLKGPV